MTFRSALLAAATLAVGLCTTMAVCLWGEVGLRRIEAQRALAAEVVAGRMSLREAAGHFRRLDEVAPGFPPDNSRPPEAEQVLFVRVLGFVWEHAAQRQRFAAAARCYAEAFAAHPQLLSGPPSGHLYYAACAAAQAGCGQGRDAADLDDKSRAAFRCQALEWLRAELAARRRLLVQGLPVSPSAIEDWLAVPDFAGVREADALARLPESERQAWQKLWAEVANTLARAERATAPEPKAGSKIPLPER
jgi:hypothetical protein